jgi:hypothetical protein
MRESSPPPLRRTIAGRNRRSLSPRAAWQALSRRPGADWRLLRMDERVWLVVPSLRGESSSAERLLGEGPETRVLLGRGDP